MRAGLNKHQWGVLLASALFACACLLTPVRNAEAVASLNLSTGFSSADPARADSSMDAGGTWNGTAEVTNTTGDKFVLTVQNLAAGLPVNDSAFDPALGIDVQSGFRLPTSPYIGSGERVDVTIFAGEDESSCLKPGAACSVTVGVQA